MIDSLAAGPRFAGSADESRARDFCAGELRGLGFSVREREFEFSEWPGRWGIPLLGAIALCAIFAVAAAAAASRDARLGGLMGFVVLPLGARVFRSARRGATARIPWLRSRSTNLEATRGSARVWLVAHLDTKSQTVPMLLRVASHFAIAAVLAVEAMLLILTLSGSVSHARWDLVEIAGLVAAIPSLLCFVRNDSAGALDNASGVAAVLLAARLLPGDLPLGVLLTSGEELDLAGARAWAADRAQSPRTESGTVMLNCDTVDDAGAWRCMYDRPATEAVSAAKKTASAMSLALRTGRIVPGILTDSIAFSAEGIASVTIGRGTPGTLARLHTIGDNFNVLTGTGAAVAARMLSGMAKELV